MTPDNLALSGFEEDLRNDINGSLLKARTAYFEQHLVSVNQAMRGGVDSQTFQRLDSLRNALETAKKTLSQVWHGLHGP